MTSTHDSPPNAVILERLSALRAAMAQRNWDGYYLASADAHQSEYLPDCWKRREYLSGFTGSRGDLLISGDKAWLWTDSRYFVQAEQELAGTGITLCKLQIPGSPTLEQIVKESFAGKTLAVDPETLLIRDRELLLGALKECLGTLAYSEGNLVDAVWTDQPPLPASPIEVYPLSYAGLSVADKLQLVRDELKRCLHADESAFIHPVTTLDAIAWLFNIRAQDVPFNPVKIAFALITGDQARLYTRHDCVAPLVREHLTSAGVAIHPYDEFLSSLPSCSGRWIVDPATTNLAIAQKLEAAGATVHQETSPITRLKAVKNPTEIGGMRAAHLRDGIAVTQVLWWLSTAEPSESIDEVRIGDRLEEFRAAQPLFRGPSFPTIAGFGPHGAIVHYRATPESALVTTDTALLLIDSGAQYLDGTTDVTRTVHRGVPTREEMDRYTRVLKGHLAIARVVFPKGTDGSDLDALARVSLWSQGLNYGHGTGHGVGCYLNVHEGPQRIAIGRRSTPLAPGMVVSNEPGYYQTGCYGIRIENLELVVERPDLSSEEYGPFLGFETLTVIPYCRRLIAADLLTVEERVQIDRYHQQVLATLSPHLPLAVQEWLHRECAPLP